MKIGFVSLGCSKNLVDTEMMIGIFKNHEFSIVNDSKQADIIVVNTCRIYRECKTRSNRYNIRNGTI